MKGTMVEEPEPAAIRAAAAGDTVAFEHLVRLYQAPVWRFLKNQLRDPQLAEDVTQETFVRAYRKLDTFAFQSKFSTWLIQIARNAGVDAIRSRDRRARLLESVPLPAPTAVPDARAEIHAGLDHLSPKLREALLLVEVFGLGYREAAEVLAAPEGTVKSRVHQAREQLHRWLRSEERRADEV